jgi:hypothetical protein
MQPPVVSWAQAFQVRHGDLFLISFAMVHVVRSVPRAAELT